jgi:FkbM family methyltransferase
MRSRLTQLRQDFARRSIRLGLLAAAADQHRGRVPDLDGTIEFETSFGSLYLEAADKVITPGLTSVGEWEPGETALFGERLKPGMTVLDIGAHVGYYSCLAGRLVGPRGLVIAFEPSPRNYELLLANVWHNGLTNVVCYPWAVTERSSFIPLYLSADNTGDHRLSEVAGREAVAVRGVALDDLVALKPPVDVVKIDVQGAEESVFRGAKRLLAESPRALITAEFDPGELAAAGRDPRSLLSFYRALGYTIQTQHPEERGVLDLSDDEILDFCRGDGGGERHTNLVLTKRAASGTGR